METKEQVLIQEPIFGPKTKMESDIELICKVADFVYPNNWCLAPCEPNLRITVGAENRLLIRFPAATINNGRDGSYDIEDVFIAIPINGKYSRMSGSTMYMMRSTVKLVEFYNGYFHSHASRAGSGSTVNNYFVWRNLCLGGQTVLTELTYTLSAEGIAERPLESLLISLYSYVRHESIDGGPYFRYKSVIFPQERSGGCSYLQGLKLTIYDSLIESFINDDSREMLEISISLQRGDNVNVDFHNAFASMSDRLKHILFKLYEDEIISKTVLLTNVGLNDSCDEFVCVQRDSSNDYINKARQRVEALKGLETDSILKFRNASVNFTIRDVDASEELEIPDIKAVETSPELVRSIAIIYKERLEQYLEDEEKYS